MGKAARKSTFFQPVTRQGTQLSKESRVPQDDSSEESSLDATPLKGRNASKARASKESTKIVSKTPLQSRDPSKSAIQHTSWSTSSSESTPSKIVPKEEFEDDDSGEDETQSRTTRSPRKVVPTADDKRQASHKNEPSSPRRKKVVPSPRQTSPRKSPTPSPQKRKATNLPRGSKVGAKRKIEYSDSEEEEEDVDKARSEPQPKKIIPSAKKNKRRASPRKLTNASKSAEDLKVVAKRKIEDSDTEEEEEDVDKARSEPQPKKIIPSAKKNKRRASPRKLTNASKSAEELRQQENTATKNATKPNVTGTQYRSRRKSMPRRILKQRKFLKEIIKYQSSVKLLIPRLPFSRLVREVLLTFGAQMRMSAVALEALQEAAEIHLVTILEGSYEATLHARRKTLLPRDLTYFINLARNYFGCDY